jgi:hypothetical protein
MHNARFSALLSFSETKCELKLHIVNGNFPRHCGAAAQVLPAARIDPSVSDPNIYKNSTEYFAFGHLVKLKRKLILSKRSHVRVQSLTSTTGYRED